MQQEPSLYSLSFSFVGSLGVIRWASACNACTKTAETEFYVVSLSFAHTTGQQCRDWKVLSSSHPISSYGTARYQCCTLLGGVTGQNINRRVVYKISFSNVISNCVMFQYEDLNYIRVMVQDEHADRRSVEKHIRSGRGYIVQSSS